MSLFMMQIFANSLTRNQITEANRGHCNKAEIKGVEKVPVFVVCE